MSTLTATRGTKRALRYCVRTTASAILGDRPSPLFALEQRSRFLNFDGWRFTRPEGHSMYLFCRDMQPVEVHGRQRRTCGGQDQTHDPALKAPFGGGLTGDFFR